MQIIVCIIKFKLKLNKQKLNSHKNPTLVTLEMF